ncbi:MAG: acyltransferase family protein [Acidimicrobiia bacterium]
MTKPQLSQHFPALDGLRGVATFAVLAYHQEFGWAKGGYLGVSVFFTLSGYLITSLLLVEISQSGTVRYGAFAARRARRLLPAAFVGVALAVVFGLSVATDSQQRHLAGDVWAALTYMSNWRYIIQDIGYGDIFGAPSPLIHFWSLAIEGQFYVIFPALIWAVTKLTTRRIASITILVVSLWLISMAATLGLAGATDDRIYFGTDTRATELLSGSILALLYRHFYLQRSLSPAIKGVLAQVSRVAGVVAAGFLTYLVMATALESRWLYRGGLVAVGATSAVLVWSLLGTGMLARAMAWWPLRWLGLRSYGLYLYHWPVFLWLSPLRVGLEGWPLFMLRLSLSVLLADLSFRFVERPLRQVPFTTWWQRSIIPMPMALLGVGAVLVTQAAPAPLLRFDESTPVVPVATAGPPTMAIWGGELAAQLSTQLSEQPDSDKTLEIRNLSDRSCSANARSSCLGVAWRWLQGSRGAENLVILIGPNDPFGQDIEYLGAMRAWLPPSVKVTWVTHPPTLESPEATEAVLVPPTSMLELDYHRAQIAALAQHFDDQIVDLARQLEPPPEGYPPERVMKAYPLHDAALIEGLDAVAKQLSTGIRTQVGTWRIMIVGDSIAQSLGWGFTEWAEESSRAAVWNVARPGCALIREGELRDRGEMPEGCVRWATDFAAYVRDFAPDLVVVHAGPWDSKRRRFAGRNDYVTPDDPYYLDLMRRDYAEAVEVLTAGGAPILWFNMPCVHPREVAEQAVFQPERRAPQRLVLTELATQFPSLTLYDLDALVCPGGVYLDEFGDVADPRPDGVHFSPQGARWIVDTILPEIEELLSKN